MTVQTPRKSKANARRPAPIEPATSHPARSKSRRVATNRKDRIDVAERTFHAHLRFLELLMAGPAPLPQ
ncbi:hypothetical protein [Planctomicrobium sp. SH664]|uniref:hypothetical protein n=1 Tax=Planctomicrobium sp. SH664 TaxID=3448125 RepID=UPI003F5B7E26